MTLTGHQLRATLIAAGIPPAAIWPLSDNVYMPCRAAWLTGDFHRWFMKTLEALDVRAYSSESHDCDDFADLFAALARVTHRRTVGPGVAAALPIGRINFQTLPGTYHAITWAMTSDRGVIFPEPQVLFQVNNLSALQLQSISRCSD